MKDIDRYDEEAKKLGTDDKNTKKKAKAEDFVAMIKEEIETRAK